MPRKPRQGAAARQQSAPAFPAQYDETTDRIVYGLPAASGLDRTAWLRLALACLDQAGLSAAEQQHVRAAMASREGGACDVPWRIGGPPGEPGDAR